jgi:hypothetical protein
MKKLLAALALCGLVGLTAGMLAQPAISADDKESAAADGGAAADTPATDEGAASGAQPSDEPAQGDESAPVEDNGAADTDGAKE